MPIYGQKCRRPTKNKHHYAHIWKKSLFAAFAKQQDVMSKVTNKLASA